MLIFYDPHQELYQLSKQHSDIPDALGSPAVKSPTKQSIIKMEDSDDDGDDDDDDSDNVTTPKKTPKKTPTKHKIKLFHDDDDDSPKVKRSKNNVCLVDVFFHLPTLLFKCRSRVTSVDLILLVYYKMFQFCIGNLTCNYIL